MSEQYVYRYNDVNRVGDGHAQVELLRPVGAERLICIVAC